MKKLPRLLFLIFILFLTGCRSDADFQGVILEVKEESIVVGTDKVEPEASYPAFEIFVNEDTEISGSATTFAQMVDQEVEIWVANEGTSFDGNIAEKIVVKH